MLTFLAALPLLVLLWLTFKARSVRTPHVGTSVPSLVLTEIVALDDDLLVGYRDGSGARTVDSHVRSLRRKLGADVIRTIHGVGYAAEG